jgi:hypothetical protein
MYFEGRANFFDFSDHSVIKDITRLETLDVYDILYIHICVNCAQTLPGMAAWNVTSHAYVDVHGMSDSCDHILHTAIHSK